MSTLKIQNVFFIEDDIGNLEHTKIIYCFLYYSRSIKSFYILYHGINLTNNVIDFLFKVFLNHLSFSWEHKMLSVELNALQNNVSIKYSLCTQYVSEAIVVVRDSLQLGIISPFRVGSTPEILKVVIDALTVRFPQETKLCTCGRQCWVFFGSYFVQTISTIQTLKTTRSTVPEQTWKIRERNRTF